jgi:hypothetical protein
MLKPERFVPSVFGVLLPLVIATAKLQNAALSPHGQITQAPCWRRSGIARRLRFSRSMPEYYVRIYCSAGAVPQKKLTR